MSDTNERSAASPMTATIRMSDSEIMAEIGEVGQLLESLERFRESVLDHLHRLRLGELCVGGLEPTLDAGECVCAPQILSRDFKLIRAALRALDLDVGHKILSGVSRPGETRGQSSIENVRLLQQASELLAAVVASLKK